MATLTKRMRRGLAVLVSVVLVLGVVGGIAFMTTRDVVHEVHVLQRSAPRRAHALERSDRFGSAPCRRCSDQSERRPCLKRFFVQCWQR